MIVRRGIAPVVMLLGTVVGHGADRGVGRGTAAGDGAAGRRGRVHGVDGGGLGAVAVAAQDLLGGDFGVVAEEGGVVEDEGEVFGNLCGEFLLVV